MRNIILAITVLFTLTVHAQNNENMKEVQAFLKECGAFFIATADGDQPHVRPFGVSEIIDGRLYIMTGKVKDVYKQLAKKDLDDAIGGAAVPAVGKRTFLPVAAGEP